MLDGDGDIIFSTPPRRQTLFLLAMIELGTRLKKPVFLVNSMISDCPLTGRNNTTLHAARRLFGQCTAVSLRDPESLEYVQNEMPKTNAVFIPDSLFCWFPLYSDGTSHLPLNGDFLLPYPEKCEYWGRLDFSRPYVCIGGGALAASQPDRSVQCYGRLVDAIRQLGYRVYLTENDLPDSFLQRVAREKNVGIVPVDAPILLCGAVLAHARLFISGRYHPSIFASLGGTPCIFLGSHAHKMGSLSQVLGMKRPTIQCLSRRFDIAEIVSTARKYLDQGETLRARIRQVAKLRCDEATASANLSETAHQWLTTKFRVLFCKLGKHGEIVVIGGGGHAKVVISILRKLDRHRILGYTDLKDNGALLGVPYLGSDRELAALAVGARILNAVLAVGQVGLGELRHDLWMRLHSLGPVLSLDRLAGRNCQRGSVGWRWRCSDGRGSH